MKFDDALNINSLITKSSKERIFKPFKDHLPYGLGMFSQKFQNQDLIWAYGQYDCYSSLYIKVPSKDLTLLITANNNLMSDPARLIYGDVTNSLFALSFLKNYVFNLSKISLLENSISLSLIQNRLNKGNSEFYRKKMLAQALEEIF